MRHLALGMILASASPALAEELQLIPPLNCDLSGTCYIQQFVDRDPGPDARDFACGTLSYDGHKGTDFALPSLALQAQGVDVVASAPGVVKGVRDGMQDILQGTPGAPDVSNVECGNGVVIDNGGGWETQYCHMANGSIAVIPGQTVVAGDRLGLVGLSGQTQFPHVHLSVRKDGAVIGPFDLSPIDSCGTQSADTLWAAVPPHAPGGVVSAGWAQDVPDYAAVKAGTAAMPLAQDANIVLWGYFFGGRVGDLVSIVIEGPAGIVFSQETPLDRTQAQLFRAGGKRAPAGGWPAGDYTGTIRLTRDGAVLDEWAIPGTIPAG